MNLQVPTVLRLFLLCLALPAGALAQGDPLIRARPEFQNALYDPAPSNAPATTLTQAKSIAVFSGSVGAAGDARTANDRQPAPLYLTQVGLGKSLGGGSVGFSEFGPPIVLVNGESSPSRSFVFIGTNAVQIQLLVSFPRGQVDYCLDCNDPRLGLEQPAPAVFPLVVNPTSNVTVTLRSIAYDEFFNEAEAAPVTITFIPIFTLEVTNTGGGGFFTATGPPGAQFGTNGGRLRVASTNGSVIHLQASTNAGWSFLHWTNGGGGTNLSLALTLDRDRTVQGVFGTPLTTIVTFFSSDGVIERQPDAPLYPYASTVRLTAIPTNAAYFFRFWQNDASDQFFSPLDFVITNANPTVGARFAQLPAGNFALSLRVTGEGSVARDPATSNFLSGSSVMLTATPAAGSAFMSWDGDLISAVNPLTVVMNTNKALTAIFAPVGSSNLQPAFRFEQEHYAVGEGQTNVTLRVFRNFSGLATVNYATGDGSANAGADFGASSGTLQFQSGEAVKTITVTILDDFVVEGDHFFTVRLSHPSSGGLASPSVARVTIHDDDVQTSSSFLSVVPVTPIVESDLGSLRVFLTGDTNNLGQWRLSWERSWRSSGTAAGRLQPGRYRVEFRPLSGFRAPDPVTLEVMAALETRSTNAYEFVVSTPTGSLTVFLDPPEVATNADPGCQGMWRLAGGPFTNSGATVFNIPAGSYNVGFRGLNGNCGWGTPLAREVVVRPGQSNWARASYYTNSGGSIPQALTFSTDILPVVDNTLPQTYCGQITTEFGTASGVVVKERVVLTAAHVVFDDYSLSWAGDGAWLFQRHVPDYNPAPQLVRGYYVNSGYVPQRQAEGTPGVSQPASFDLDVAALYFYEAAGRGGFGGYLVSETPAPQWLQINTPKALVGYPVEGIPLADVGKMHGIGPTFMSFVQTTGAVFTCSQQIRGLPGNSGGPLCVQWTNGYYYPAGIHVGGSDRAIVRAIDSRAVEAINLAELTSNLETNQTGGGVVRFGVNVPAGTCYEFATVTLEPASALAAGAQWRVHYKATSGLSVFTNSSTHKIVLNNKPDFLELADAEGFLTPDPINLSLGCQPTNLTFTYVQLLPRLDVLNGRHLILSGVTNRTYRVEYNSRIGTTNSWTPLTTITFTANNNVTILSNALSPVVTTNRFFRAVRVP